MAATTIPTEILRQIFSDLPPVDLCRVSLATPPWRSISQEALYNSPRLFPASLPLFIRTLLAADNDILAAHVRTLTVTWQSYHAEPIDPAALLLFQAAADRFGLPHDLPLTDDHVMLLLHLLPRVHTLHFSPADTAGRETGYLGAPDRPLPLALLSVRHLSCSWISQNRGVSSAMLLTLLTLPRILTLSVDIIDEIDEPYPPVTSALRELSTLHSTLSIQSLGRILKVACALTRLSFASTVEVRGVYLDVLHTALEPLRSSLAVLELHLYDRRSSWADAIGVRTAGRAWGEWPALRRLYCPLRLLMGDCELVGKVQLWEVLPSGIEDLEVWESWAGERAVDEVVGLMQRKREVVPRLKRAKVWLGKSVPGRLRTACVDAGVELMET